MKLDTIKNIYFIGIGGIGMSALARYFNAKGILIGGYDKTPSPLIDELIAEGIDVHFKDLGEHIPNPFNNPEQTLVVYTPAIPANFGELNELRKSHTVIKRSELLGLITQSSKGLGVAGTHGKTTTSSMLAYVLSQSKLGCSAFLGGIASNFNSNVWVDGNSEYTVIEADEYDRSFLRLSPFASIITAMDPDHLDIYGTTEEFEKGFSDYVNKHENAGWIIHQYQLNIQSNKKTITYGIHAENASLSGINLRVEEGYFCYDVHWSNQQWNKVKLGLPGKHNAENALAVIAMCIELGLSEDEIRTGLKNFKGVKRRFEYKVRTENFVYIDDYAHHPTELNALISAVREMYPTQKITGIFQPHLFSRTRDFLSGFCSELSQLDEVIVMPIYPAREEPIPGVTSEVVMNGISVPCHLYTEIEILNWAKNIESGVVLTIGAGDIDRLVPQLTQLWS